MSELASKLEQAQQLIQAGRAKDARAALMRLLPKHPGEAGLHRALSVVCMLEGEKQQALYYADRAAKARPTDAAMHHNLGVMRAFAGDTPASITAFEKAIELSPGRLDSSLLLCRALASRDRLTDTIRVARTALEHHPLNPDLTVQLGGALLRIGKAREAVESLHTAMTAHPDDVNLANQRAFIFNYIDDADPRETLAAHIEMGQRLARTNPPAAPRATPTDPERRLRLACISPDLNAHSVAFFIEPLLQHLDRGSFHITCYDTGGIRDAINARLRPLADQWREVNSGDHVATARSIMADQIDILIDLAGLTTNNSLRTLALAPAPLIGTYLGYPNTTGVPGVDFRIVDSITDPSPAADNLATERLARLDPCFLCYRPPKDAPDVSPLPSASGEPFTFGSFNHQQKLSEKTVALWSRALQGVPGSRLLLKNAALVSEEARASVIERFAAHAIAADRLILIDAVESMREHLALYARLDAALDPPTYNGTTTTCEALYMGVPVVTLAGQVHAARVGASLLTCVGHSRLVAANEDEYVGIAQWLATEREQLVTIRAGLRQDVAKSPLCDEAGFSRRFERMLRELWRKKCDQQ